MEKVSNTAWMRTPGFIVTTLIGGFVAYGYNTWKHTEAKEEKRLDRAEIIVIATPGGMLEVSKLIKNEEFGWSTSHTCLLIDCAALIKPTITEIRVPVHYVYRIPLAATWTLTKTDGAYSLRVPLEQPSIPPAVDFTQMEMKTSKGWLSPSVQKNREMLLKQLMPALEVRATQRHYLEAQRAESTKTVREFALKWLQDQGESKSLKGQTIQVTFGGEKQPAKAAPEAQQQ